MYSSYDVETPSENDLILWNGYADVLSELVASPLESIEILLYKTPYGCLPTVATVYPEPLLRIDKVMSRISTLQRFQLKPTPGPYTEADRAAIIAVFPLLHANGKLFIL